MKNMIRLICLVIALGLVLVMTGCILPFEPPPPKASFEITDWTQDYYEYFEEYSSYVYVYYKATNTGSVDIDYYEVWIEVTCADGSKYQEWTNGLNLAQGTYVTDYTMINTMKKRVVSVSVTRYELTSYDW